MTVLFTAWQGSCVSAAITFACCWRQWPYLFAPEAHLHSNGGVTLQQVVLAGTVPLEGGLHCSGCRMALPQLGIG